MTGDDQLGLFDPDGRIPSEPVDQRTAAILRLVAGDDLHRRDRQAVTEAILADARAHGGEIDPNRVRAAIPSWVFPRVVGPVYRTLAIRGVIAPDGWVISDDVSGRNSGRPARRYRLTAAQHRRAS